MAAEISRVFESGSADETSHLGMQIGAKFRGGEVIELIADLGGGKTTLTKGLAAGIGSSDVTGSPTFTLTRQYRGRGGLVLHHFDFYRLHEPGIIELELAEVLQDPLHIVVIEWGDPVRGILPAGHPRILLERLPDNETARRITATFGSEFEYLFTEGAA